MRDSEYNKKILERYLLSDLSKIRFNEIYNNISETGRPPNGLNDVLKDLYLHAKHLNYRGAGENYLDVKKLTNCYMKTNKATSTIWQCLFAEDLINEIEPVDECIFNTL